MVVVEVVDVGLNECGSISALRYLRRPTPPSQLSCYYKIIIINNTFIDVPYLLFKLLFVLLLLY